MDGSGFDEFTRRLATGRSRRSVLRGLVGGGAALVATRVGTSLTEAADKVTICHWNGTNYDLISVSTSAIPAHSAHPGDIVAPDFTSDSSNCGACGIACNENEACVGGLCEAQGCDPGQQPDGNDCASCQPGTYSDTGLACFPCAAGTYAPNAGQAACSPCDCAGSCDAVTGGCASGQVPLFGECIVDGDCQSGQCGCNAPPGFPFCFCREEICLAEGADCGGGIGAASCCEGDCILSGGVATCIPNVCPSPCPAGKSCVNGSVCV